MKVRKLTALILTLCLALALAACGGASQNVSMSYDAAAPMAEAPAMESMSYDAADRTLTNSGADSSAAIPQDRKWIITVDISAETEDMDTLLAALDQQIADMGGYVEGQNVNNGSTYAQRRYRNASLTVRIPAADVDAFTQQVAGVANVTSSSKNLEDITLAYNSTESRMNALRTEEARLLELMAQAESMSDLLEIEARLTDVRYELEDITTRLRTYDNRVDYATVYLYISEVQEYTPAAERTVWQRIREDFGANLRSLGEDIVDIFVWVLSASPYLVVWAAVLTGGFFALRRVKKKQVFKKEKKNDPE